MYRLPPSEYPLAAVNVDCAEVSSSKSNPLSAIYLLVLFLSCSGVSFPTGQKMNTSFPLRHDLSETVQGCSFVAMSTKWETRGAAGR